MDQCLGINIVQVTVGFYMDFRKILDLLKSCPVLREMSSQIFRATIVHNLTKLTKERFPSSVRKSLPTEPSSQSILSVRAGAASYYIDSMVLGMVDYITIVISGV